MNNVSLQANPAPLGVGAVLNGVAYYCDTIEGFLKTSAEDVLSRLLRATPEDDINDEQNGAWKEEIRCLKVRLKELGAEGYIVFEYNILRMAKRIDVVLLLRNVVYSLEFKVNQPYAVDSMEQAIDYALRLKQFHKMNKDMYICPILIATAAKDSFYNPVDMMDIKTLGLQKTNGKKLVDIIKKVDGKYGSDEEFDFNKWFWSDYRPSPGIVEAAVDAFNSVPVSEIARSEAGQEGIDACVKAISDIIVDAKTNKKKCICFVTGVPGAGKTLVGLDIAARHSNIKDDLYSVYISGNGPLVKVLQEAMARAWKDGGKVKSMAAGKRAASALVQDAYEFRNAYLNTFNAPPENVLIFDEAQRVWNKEQVDQFYLKRKRGEEFNLPHASEAELAIRAMDRHEDWAVIVCLVGLGQDIHTGEVGIYGWFHPVLDKYKDWELYYSDHLFTDSIRDEAEKLAVSHFPGSHEVSDLHLGVSVRSFRAEKLSDFANELIEGNVERAKELYATIADKYPIYVTRDLQKAKEWLAKTRMGSERIGMILSSTAKEMEEFGVDTPMNRFYEWPKWFLENDPNNVDSSNSLHFGADEFAIQGLEIDYSLLCWGGDFQRKGNSFVPYVLRNRRTEWVEASKAKHPNCTGEEKARWIANSYRVLLTRARQGMVIYVPEGLAMGVGPRNRRHYDETFDYLTKQIGLPLLVEAPKHFNSVAMMGPSLERVQAKLEKLDALKEAGMISEEEYKAQREAVLENYLEDRD